MLWVITLIASPSAARVLEVGPTRTLKLPSQAASIAVRGDVVRIDPGIYADCALWRASGIVIEAAAQPVMLTGKVCFGVGIFVVAGSDITIRGLGFAGAEGEGHNVAGIRLVGDNLTVEHSRFLHNENGILAAGSPASILRVSDSTFIGNGACIIACAHGIYAGTPIARLDVQRCVFLDTRVAHHIKSRAQETIVRDSRIEDGASGTSSYLIETPNGGNLLVANNVLGKGPNSSNPRVAVSIGIEGEKNPTTSLVIRDNQFRNDGATETVFVRNSTRTPAELSGNTVSGAVQLLEGPGVVSAATR
jgi:hypothetical protein